MLSAYSYLAYILSLPRRLKGIVFHPPPAHRTGDSFPPCIAPFLLPDLPFEPILALPSDGRARAAERTRSPKTALKEHHRFCVYCERGILRDQGQGREKDAEARKNRASCEGHANPGLKHCGGGEAVISLVCCQTLSFSLLSFSL